MVISYSMEKLPSLSKRPIPLDVDTALCLALVPAGPDRRLAAANFFVIGLLAFGLSESRDLEEREARTMLRESGPAARSEYQRFGNPNRSGTARHRRPVGKSAAPSTGGSTRPRSMICWRKGAPGFRVWPNSVSSTLPASRVLVRRRWIRRPPSMSPIGDYFITLRDPSGQRPGRQQVP